MKHANIYLTKQGFEKYSTNIYWSRWVKQPILKYFSKILLIEEFIRSFQAVSAIRNYLFEIKKVPGA